MITYYQIVILGGKNLFENDILNSLFRHIEEIGLEKEAIVVITKENFEVNYRANAPAFCLYFGNNDSPFQNLNILRTLIKDATLILPIVNKFYQFSSLVPPELSNVNGYELSTVNDIEGLVSSILEGFSLLRLSRRLFISYKRNESSSVAIQLFEQLNKNGFDVFLDTHSIRPGEPFQEELWHRMADTDVVVLLNTPGFLKSNWTTQELAQANAMSIGILQLIWPSHKLEREATLSIPYQLAKCDFGNNKYSDSSSYLIQNSVDQIVSQVESLRARSLASRQDNLVTEFISAANMVGVKVDLQPDKFITLLNSDNDELVIIPTIGVPQAFTYNQSEELVSIIRSKNVKSIYILYDHRNIREKWINHLAWLDNYLPIKTIKILEAKKWLQSI
jgi:hypothetical protein